MAEEASVSTRVDAPAEQVFELVSDLKRMGEWSPECTGIDWLGGATTAAVGAKFKGHNKNGIRRWSTTSTIVTMEPGRELAYDVAYGPLPVARWIYRVEPDGPGACTLTETWQDRRGGFMNFLGWIGSGVKERKEHNTDGMRQTVERIKAAAEAGQ